MEKKISPLAPPFPPEMPPVEGVCLTVAATGIGYKDRLDLLLVLLEEKTTVAGVFTKSHCPAATIDWCRDTLDGGHARALLVNAGNANAFTGQKGRDAVQTCADLTAAAAKCRTNEVFLASTGVIGEPMDAQKFEPFIRTMPAAASPKSWIEAAKAIMTTDTYPKLATREAGIGEHKVTINGIAKGSGMIAPNMATFLSFIFTDAPISAAPLQTLLMHTVEKTFNAITVDGETSTNDCLLLFATGMAEKRAVPRIQDHEDPRLDSFRASLEDLLQDLALQVVRDGEGASKLIKIIVETAKTHKDAHKIAMSIANSPLVKTAVAGEDANWGRVVMAVGKADGQIERDKIDIWFGPYQVACQGQRSEQYNEQMLSAYMKHQEIEITIQLNLGDGSARIHTCDLTDDYISINAHYRT
ncbi:MAG: bifunctional glutamate N-acetyltransferase/amino-acid acetyltransferase ArgJ [Alphaproteobacteria bacterium]|nr:bifunctional glutamate N-acetyltransferase/amino-acid acetyltransferase ArgJ [Alphaproteobacteria bacterium]